MCAALFQALVSALTFSVSPYISDSVLSVHIGQSDLNRPEVQAGLKYAEKIWEFRNQFSVSQFIEPTPDSPRLHLRYYQKNPEIKKSEKTAMIYLPGLRAIEPKSAQFIYGLRESLNVADFYSVDLRQQGASRGETTLPYLIDVKTFDEYRKDFEAVIDYVTQKGYKSVTVVAHSTGVSGPLLALLKNSDRFAKIKEVFLIAPGVDTSPDVVGRADNFGRIPVVSVSKVMRLLRNLGLLKGDQLIPGYKPQNEALPSDLAFKNNHNSVEIWSSFFLQLMALTQPSDKLDQPHSWGPTVNWTIASGEYTALLLKAQINSKVPIKMYLAKQDYTVRSDSAVQLCRRIVHCSYFLTEGFHDLPYENHSVTTLFTHEIEESLR